MKLFGRKNEQPASESSDSPLSSAKVWQPYDLVLANSQRDPDGLAIRSYRGELTNREYFSRSKKLAQVLRDEGVKPGDVVAAELDGVDGFLMMAALFHEAAIGCVATSGSDLPEYVDWLITTDPNKPKPANTKLLLWDTQLEERVYKSGTVLLPNRYESHDSVCRLLFSSGTTGVPKGVPLTVSKLAISAERSLSRTMKPLPFLTLVSLNGISGFITAVASLWGGVPYLCPENPDWLCSLLANKEIKTLKGSPMQLGSLMNAAKAKGISEPGVEQIQSTGSTVSTTLARDLESFFGGRLTNRFGSSESGALCAGTGYRIDPTDIGELNPEVELEVVDESDNPVPQGSTGRFRWKTPVQATEYFKNPEETKRFFRDGWFYSGDTGYISADGHVHLTGRESEVLNIGGAKYNTAELDQLAVGHPGIADAAAFVFLDLGGQPKLGIAIVVKGEFNEDSYRSEFTKRAKGLVPQLLIQFPSIPRGELGKVKRAELARTTQELIVQMNPSNRESS